MTEIIVGKGGLCHAGVCMSQISLEWMWGVAVFVVVCKVQSKEDEVLSEVWEEVS